jgi:O-antigen ligase
MPPSVALALWFILLLALWRFDPAKVSGTSVALWLPLVEFFIICSRLPSQWLGLIGTGAVQQDVLEQGNGVDRLIYIALIVLSVAVLIARSFEWSEFLARNVALTVFLSFCLISVAWSDYPYVAFKRWFRDLAPYATMLVVLSDRRPVEAFRTLCRRACYLLVPLCILTIKYFPDLSRQYDPWSGEPMYVGITTSKNTLGGLCLFSGLFFVWDILARWRQRKERGSARVLIVNVVFVWMILWLLKLAQSATSFACLMLGCAILAAAHTGMMKRRPGILLTLVPLAFLAYVFLAFGLGIDINAAVAQALGRDPTLTGRTLIWDTLLSVDINPLIGTGYESFWMGKRLLWIWERRGIINEAHNGFLQVYLNIGYIGLFLLCCYLLSAYFRIRAQVRASSDVGRFAFALLMVLLFYNLTEAAFGTGPIWLAIMPAALAVPQPGFALTEVMRRSQIHRTAAARVGLQRPSTVRNRFE